MDNQVSSQFIASLIKSIQVVCHGNVEFNHNIEIVGHIYLHVDKCHKFNYVLNEEVLKDFDSTKFVSNSFPAEPPSKEPERKRRKNATPSSTTESDGATEIITISNDADELSSKSTNPPSVSTASPTIVVPSTASTSARQRSRRSSFPANQSALPSSLESERTPPSRHTTTSSQSQTLTQPQAKGQGAGGVSLSSDLKPEVSRQSCTSVSYSSSVRDSYAPSNPSSGSANSAATTSSTAEPDIQIKLEVPSEEEVQLLSHDMVGHVGSNHPAQSGDPSTSSGSAPLYPVMLHQNLAVSHPQDISGPSGSRMKRSHMESDIPALSSTYSVGQNEFTLHGSTMSSSSSKSPGNQWNQPSQRMMQEPPNDGLAEPMVHFDTNILGPRLSGGPTSTVTSMAQDSNPGSLEGGDAQRVLADSFYTDDGTQPAGDVDCYAVDNLLYPFPPAEQDMNSSWSNRGSATTSQGLSDQSGVQPFAQNESGPSIHVNVKKSKWDRRHYCLYCGESNSKMSRHLMMKHQQEKEVVEILNLPKRSRERWLALLHLQRKGDYVHNVNVLQTGTGEILPTRRRRITQEDREFGACQYCYSFLAKGGLAAHEMQCLFKPKQN